MATRPLDDGITPLVIRQAMAAAASGRLAEACALGERGLANGGDVAALNAMLGMLRGRSGQAELAARHLKIAHHAQPLDATIAHNLAQALLALGQDDEAMTVLADDVVAADGGGRLLRLRAFLAQRLGQFAGAVTDYEAIVERWPDDWESWNNLGNARRGAGDLEGAVAALRKAVQLAPDSAPTRFNLATSLNAVGWTDEGQAELKRMADDYPDDPVPLVELHAVLKELSQDEPALDAIERAIRRAPEDLSLLLGKASHLASMQRGSESEAAYLEVLDVDPTNVFAYIGLATHLDLTNRTSELGQLLSEAEERSIAPEGLNFIRAIEHRRAKRFKEGLAAVEEVPADLEPARRLHLEGQLLEGVGRYDEAFAAFTRMNEFLLAETPHAEARGAKYSRMVRERRDSMTAEWMARWREDSLGAHPPVAFLYGFPRSGTTLLDTMLMGHPNIEVLEEERALQAAFQLFEDYDAIAAADDRTIEEARKAYFAHAGTKTPLLSGNLLVDKNPLAINSVPVMRRLFPEAKHILALRHPCDVLLSCFVTNFRMNDGMANFARLETGASLYDVSFDFFERVREHMDIDVHTVVYERVVADRDAEMRALLEFLELGWHDQVLDHEATARRRGRIKTASYAQVVEPIYQRSAGRWVNYRKQMEPVLPILAPWIEKFGYEA